MNTLFCPAKVNLFLAIHGKDPVSGYHFIETVMARLSADAPFDQIHIEPAENLKITCSDDTVPTDERNSVWKAIRVLEEETGRELPYSMQIEKNIPPESGLGGASSNAAAVMIFVNENAGLGIPHLRLMELAAKVGMDVPFFVSGSPVALCTHFGEEVTGLPNLPKNLRIEVHQTGIRRSTQKAYEDFDIAAAHRAAFPSSPLSPQSSLPLQNALLQEDPHAILKALHNDFELIYPLPSLLKQNPKEPCVLSGSGGAFAVFGVTNS